MSLKPGQIYSEQPPAPLGTRDAFHFPCVLVTSDHPLFTRDDVIFDPVNPAKVVPSTRIGRHAIVDPFVKEPYIPPGTAFWVCVEPELAGTPRHQFEIKVVDEAIRDNQSQPAAPDLRAYRAARPPGPENDGEDEEDDGCSYRGC